MIYQNVNFLICHHHIIWETKVMAGEGAATQV